MQLTFLRSALIDYPSGSALEYFQDTLYLTGDDINYILCLDKNWNSIHKINLFEFEGNRISKADKPDLECATVIKNMLYVLGSGSKSPQRDVAYLIRLPENEVKKISTAAFYAIFRDRKLIPEMNIEGFSVCKDKLLFFNRGNTISANQLIITDQKILKKQFPDSFKVMPVKATYLNEVPVGISGAFYDNSKDILVLTASAEDTGNAYDDGKIIGSMIGIVNNAYSKLFEKEFLIDDWLELEKIHAVFTHQKIESICITDKTENSYKCTLVADNDDGKSVLFEIELTI